MNPYFRHGFRDTPLPDFEIVRLRYHPGNGEFYTEPIDTPLTNSNLPEIAITTKIRAVFFCMDMQKIFPEFLPDYHEEVRHFPPEFLIRKAWKYCPYRFFPYQELKEQYESISRGLKG